MSAVDFDVVTGPPAPQPAEERPPASPAAPSPEETPPNRTAGLERR
jgi:hypothetical protein